MDGRAFIIKCSRSTDAKMMMKIYIMMLVCCNSFTQLFSLELSISAETSRELIRKNTDAGYTLESFGWRRNSTKAFESSQEHMKTKPLTIYATPQKQQVEKNGAVINRYVNTQRLYGHPLEYNDQRPHKNYPDSRLYPGYPGNIRSESQNNIPRRRLSSKISCSLPANKNRQRCLRKIRRRKTEIPFSDMNKKMDFNPSFAVKNDLPINRPEYVNNVSSSLSRSSPAVTYNPTPAVYVNSISDERKIIVNPCTCYWNPDNCGCNCVGSMNYDDFQNVSKSFFPCRNFTFTMTEGQHYALPPNLFSNIKRVEVFSLIISNSTFEYICDPTPMTSPFKGVLFSVSAVINLKNVSVRRGWNWKPFEQLQSSSGGQVNIIFEDCKLKRLTSDFSNLAKGQVDTIDISKSSLEMVGSNAFGTFVNMTSFRVPNNKIKDLRRTDFPEVLPKLVEMDIRNNQLQNLEDDLFKNMPNLKQISLSGNPLIVLSEKTFHDVIGQAHLEGLSDIPLYCDCRLQWLKDSKLSKNEVIKKNMDGAICKRPSYLRGIPLEYLSKEHLICP